MKYKLLYYLVLLIVMVSWTSTTSFPPTVLRVAFIIAVILPGFWDKNGLLIAALTCFWSIATNGYAYSYMPTMPNLYAFVVLGAVVVFSCYNKLHPCVNIGTLLFLFMLVTFSDVLCYGSLQNRTYVQVVLLMFPLFIVLPNKKSIDYFTVSFMVISFVLSFYTLTTQSLFAGNYGIIGGYERIGWMDPNYLGMAIGIGASIGFYNIIFKNHSNWIYKATSISTIVTSIPAMLLLASRGALLCLISSIIINLFFSKTRKTNKIMLIVLGIIFIVFLYSNSYFDIIEARIHNDDVTRSNRTEIWQNKLMYFTNNGNIFNYFFGMGAKEGLAVRLSSYTVAGFHNDFLAFLVCYGIVGLISFVTFLLYPLRMAKRSLNVSNSNVIIYANTIYLVLASCTLEPFLAGNFLFYAFVFYTMLMAKYSRYEQ